MPTWIWPESTAQPTAAVRLGRAIHVLAYALVAATLLFTIMGFVFVGGGADAALNAALVLAGVVLLVGGAGRFFRYVLAGE